MESEKSIKECFSAMGSCLLLADMMLSACSAVKAGGFLQFPGPAVLNPVPGSLPIPVCSVISGHSLDAMSLKKENGHEWDTTDDSKQAISLHFSQREDTAKINLFPQKALIFTQLQFSSDKIP